MSEEAAETRLRLPATLDSLSAMRVLALDAARRAGLSPLLSQRLDLVLEEALVNIVRHAYAGGAGDVELRCRVETSGRVCLTLRDWGLPFDPLARPDEGQEARRQAGIEERAPGGLGLVFMRNMAQVGYRREAGANVLSLGVGP